MRKRLITLASIFCMLSIGIMSVFAICPFAQAEDFDQPGYAVIAAPKYGGTTHIEEAKNLRSYLIDKGWTDDRIIFLADFDASYVDGPAGKDDIFDAVTDDLPLLAGPDDLVFIAILDHAQDRNNGHTYFRTSEPGDDDDEEETEYIKDKSIDKKVDKVETFGTMVVYISSPHSGGFVLELKANKRIIIADCQQDETYTTREYTFYEALTEPLADTDGDGKVSIEEAYTHMEDSMTDQTPEIYDYKTDEDSFLF